MADRRKTLHGNRQARPTATPVVARVVAIRHLRLPPAANANRLAPGKWLRRHSGMLTYGLIVAGTAILIAVAMNA